MHCMLINRTRSDLSPENYAELARLARAFYADVPPGITLVGDWAAEDQSCTFSVLELASREALDPLLERFRPYVDIEVIPVTPVSGWRSG